MLSLCALGALAAQAQIPFSHTLMPYDWRAAGFPHLTTPEARVLDQLIQRDLDSARQGDVVAFAKTFTQRRTPEERKASGIDQLTPAERATLNALVASAIAARPRSPVLTSKGPLKDPTADNIPTRRLPHVHGQVSMFVGAGSGGTSFYGGSFDAVVTDPSHRWSVDVGVSQVRGKGYWGCGPWSYSADPFIGP